MTRALLLFWLFILATSHTLVCANTPSQRTAKDLDNMRFQRLLTDLDSKHTIGPIQDIIQDKEGFIWLAGSSGLAKYDAHTFTFYYAKPNNPTSLPSNWVSSLILDLQGQLWIGTANGISRYNAKADSFISYHQGPTVNDGSNHNFIHSLAISQNGIIYAGTRSGLATLNPEQPTPQLTPVLYDTTLNKASINKLYLEANGRTLWLGYTQDGLGSFDLISKTFNHFPSNNKVMPPQQKGLPQSTALSIVHGFVLTITEDDSHFLWVGTSQGGISRLNPKRNRITHFRHHKGDKSTLPSNIIQDIHSDKDGNLWVASDHGGLSLFDRATQSFQTINHHPYDTSSLISNQVRKIFEDKDGHLWIGAFPSGVNFYDTHKANITRLEYRPDQKTSLSNGGVLCVFEDSQGIIWIGTEYGLNAYNPKKNTIKHYLPDADDPTKLRFGVVTSIAQDTQGDLWVGTWSGGLHRFDIESEQFQNYYPDPNDPHSLIGAHIWQLFFDSQGTLWIAATQGGGLARYDANNDHFINYYHNSLDVNSLSFNSVASIVEDANKRLWIGTLHGLNSLDIKTEKFTRHVHKDSDPTSLNSNNILALHLFNDQQLLVGTSSGGLNILDLATSQVEHLTTSLGLPSDQVASLTKDKDNDIWLGTPNGLTRYTPSTKQLRTLHVSDGLVGHHIQRNALLTARDGTLYAGSSSGVSIFDPAIFKKVPTPTPVVLTDLKLFNQSAAVSTTHSPLTTTIGHSQKITLEHSDRMFSIHYASLNYSQAKLTKFAYRLVGFDEKWHFVGNLTQATYTNIDAGRYRFEVKAQNPEGLWNDKPTTIDITIKPSPWRSPQAYLVYFLASVILIAIIWHNRKLKYQSKQYQILSTTDALTGIPNRHAFQTIVTHYFNKNHCTHTLGLMVIDIDHFKNINDQYGHPMGDLVIRQIAESLDELPFSTLGICRWGGEEFMVLCELNESQTPEVTQLQQRAQRLCNIMEEQTFEVGKVTCSVGAALRQHNEDFKTLFKHADNALYHAKNQGRNQAVIYSANAKCTDI